MTHLKFDTLVMKTLPLSEKLEFSILQVLYIGTIKQFETRPLTFINTSLN